MPLPNDPTLLFTVANVVATAPALVVMSPVRAGIRAAATVPLARLDEFRLVRLAPLMDGRAPVNAEDRIFPLASVKVTVLFPVLMRPDAEISGNLQAFCRFYSGVVVSPSADQHPSVCGFITDKPVIVSVE